MTEVREGHIRLATTLDLDAMVALAEAAGKTPRYEAWGRGMSEGVHVWLGLDSGRVVGFAQACPRSDADVSALVEVCEWIVSPALQDAAFLASLLHTAIGDLDAYVWLPEADAAASFFASQGFVADGATDDRGVRMVRRSDG